MRRDSLGNPINAALDATHAAVDDFIDGFLAYETRAASITAAAEQEPDCCIANVYAGFLWMFLEAPGAARCASKYMSAALHCAAAATPREQLNLGLLQAWAADDLPQALRICELISDRYPRDLVVVKIRQYFEFNRGNFPQMLRAALQVSEQNAEIPYMHGMTAFSYEQCRLLDEAESAARHALEIRRKEPWAQHALAHVMLTRGRIDDGSRFLESVADAWTGLNSFMSTHLWWHLALYYISQGRRAKVLDLYDNRCWGVEKSYSQDQIGAVSLLARMELAGIDVGDRWRDVGEHLAARAQDLVLPFLTMQYLYGLARAGRAESDALLRSVRDAATLAPQHAKEVWIEVALPACEGLNAYAHGDFDAAWRQLSAAMPRLIEAGGSHAQRDLFEQLALDAAIKSGRLAPAQQLLETRRSVDPEDVPVNSALALVYAGLGLPQLAEQARMRAESTRRRHAD